VTPQRITSIVFFTLLILIGLQLLHIFHLFLIPILWAMILAIVFFPLYRWFLALFRGRRNLTACWVLLLVILITVGPMVFFSGTLAGEALDFSGKVAGWIHSGGYQAALERGLNSPLGGVWSQIREKTGELNIEIVPLTVKFLERLTQSIAGQLQTGAKNFLVFVFNYLVTIVAFFFFLRDGEALVRGFTEVVPMSPENKGHILGRLEETVTAVVRGVGLTGVTQGALAGLAFWALGIPYPVFLALLIAFLAFLPIGGAAMVWIPASVYLFFGGHPVKALVLFIYGTLVISMVDNFLKPLLIGGKIRIPTLFLFFSILGGLSYYGFIGVFLGPVVLTLFLALIQIYRKEYLART